MSKSKLAVAVKRQAAFIAGLAHPSLAKYAKSSIASESHKETVVKHWKAAGIKPTDFPDTFSLLNPLCKVVFEGLVEGLNKAERTMMLSSAKDRKGWKQPQINPYLSMRKKLRRYYNSLISGLTLAWNGTVVGGAKLKGNKAIWTDDQREISALCGLQHVRANKTEKKVTQRDVNIAMFFSKTIDDYTATFGSPAQDKIKRAFTAETMTVVITPKKKAK